MNSDYISSTNARGMQTPERAGEPALRWNGAVGAGAAAMPGLGAALPYWQAALGTAHAANPSANNPSAALDNNNPALALLDQLAIAIVVLDAQGGVSFANASAKSELANNPWLRVERGQLCAKRAADADALQDLLWAAARGEHAALRLGEAKTKTRAKSKTTGAASLAGTASAGFSLAATPLWLGQPKATRVQANAPAAKPARALAKAPERSAAQATARASAPTHIALVFQRRQLCEPLMLHHFARQHQLTGAEEAVLRHLCQNMDQSAVAQSMGIALSTVRSHVKNMSMKTGCHGMRALQAQLAMLPPIAVQIATN
jgi:DNA-binding CsgD family transcriptional regulator